MTACSDQEIRKVASAETGVASVDIPLLDGMVKMHLSPGTYPTEIASEKANCTINIRVKGKSTELTNIKNTTINLSKRGDYFFIAHLDDIERYKGLVDIHASFIRRTVNKMRQLGHNGAVDRL